MARESSVDESDEYREFIEKVRKWHQARGTNFEAIPRVGNRRVDLLKLYRRVVDDGGYDVVSDIKQTKLGWRKIGQDFGLGTIATLPTLAFTLKTVYYKNLASFEIKHHHNKEPPPREILEDTSAKGGNLLTRTMENYNLPGSRIQQQAERQQQQQQQREQQPQQVNGVEYDGSDDDARQTPRQDDRMDLDDPGSGGGTRSLRGLRREPPSRVLFQPDTAPARQARQISGTGSSPVPIMNGMNGNYIATQMASQTLANYEPRAQIPMTVRPVTTLANNPDLFRANQKSLRERQMEGRTQRGVPTIRRGMPPGTGFPGPNIYTRTLLALQSGELEEQEFALHHIVKISHERGDKYRFDGFPGLAEALIEKMLEASSMIHKIDWSITFQEEESKLEPNVLDGMNGTPDVLERIEKLASRCFQDKIETEFFSRRMALVNEAGLIVRNMVMQEENVDLLTRYPSIRDTVVILMHLPDAVSTTEIRHYAFEIAEQISRYFPTLPEDPLLKCLVNAAVESTDRGIVISCLRAISRMGMHSEQVVPLQAIPVRLVQKVCDWLLVEDEDLRGASLDFFYRYTVVVENLDALLQTRDIQNVVKSLMRLLLHGARVEEKKESQPEAPKPPQSREENPIPEISQDLIDQLLGYDEPERSSQWLKTCFEEDTNGEITQIALWQAYGNPFGRYATQRPLLPAKDFITNVSNTFTHASAQVLNQNGPNARFVIKGIRARKVPVDPRGRAYMRCLWHIPNPDYVPPIPAIDATPTSPSTTTKLAPNGTPTTVPTPAPTNPTPAGPGKDPSKPTRECGDFALTPKAMWEHVVRAHINLVKDSDGQYDFTALDGRLYACSWAGCAHFAGVSPDIATPFAIGMHVKTHLPDCSGMSYQRSKYNVTGDRAREPLSSVIRTWPMLNTMTDERHDAVGLPLTASLCLRNLARNIPKTATGARAAEEEAEEEEREGDGGDDDADSLTAAAANQTIGDGDGDVTMAAASEPNTPSSSSRRAARRRQRGNPLVWRTFAPVRDQIYYCMAHNQSLREYLATLARVVDANGG